MRIRDDIRRRAGPAMDGQHADWLHKQCEFARTGRCDREVCRRRGGWRHDAGGDPSCIPQEILRRLDALPDAALNAIAAASHGAPTP